MMLESNIDGKEIRRLSTGNKRAQVMRETESSIGY